MLASFQLARLVSWREPSGIQVPRHQICWVNALHAFIEDVIAYAGKEPGIPHDRTAANNSLSKPVLGMIVLPQHGSQKRI